jgi:hypothetical protein
MTRDEDFLTSRWRQVAAFGDLTFELKSRLVAADQSRRYVNGCGEGDKRMPSREAVRGRAGSFSLAMETPVAILTIGM